MKDKVRFSHLLLQAVVLPPRSEVGGLLGTVTSSKNGLFPKFNSAPKMGVKYTLSYNEELWWNGSSFGQGILYITIRDSTGETAKSALYFISAASCSKIIGDDLPITFSRVNSYNIKLISKSSEDITLYILTLNASSNE